MPGARRFILPVDLELSQIANNRMDPSRDTFPTLRHLRGFLLITEGMSLHAAARAIHLSQPALTLALAGLERRYGEALFERKIGCLKRTKAAAVLERRARRCLDYLHQAAARTVGADEIAIEQVMKRLTIPHLRALDAIGEFKSFTAAAVQLGVRAPSIHRSTSALEEAVGVRLVRRSSSGAECTALGQEVARLFALALAELRAAADEMNASRGEIVGRISIGTMHIAALDLVPAALLRLAKRFPGASFTAVEDDYGMMLQALQAGQLDFLCSTMRSTPPPDIAAQALFQSDLCIICRRGHPVLRERPIDLSALARYPWVGASPHTGVIQRFLGLFERAGIEPPRIVVQTHIFEVKRSLILQGEFLAIMSQSEIFNHPSFDKMEVVKDILPAVTRPVWLLWRRHAHPTPLQQHFAETFLEVLREYHPGAPAQWDGKATDSPKIDASFDNATLAPSAKDTARIGSSADGSTSQFP